MLGNWCKIFKEKMSWQKLKDNKVLQYHWNDQSKLQSDYNYLNEFADKILDELVIKLNKYHNKNLSKNFWKILLGNWLYTFIHISYDRWFTISKAFDEYQICETKVIDIDKSKFVPQSVENFIDLIHQDKWNHFFFSEIIKFKDYKELKIKNIKDEMANDNYIRFKFYENNFLIQKFNKAYQILRVLYSKIFIEKFFCIDTYLGKKNEFLLNMKLKSFPLNFIPKVKLFIQPNFENRKKINLDFVTNNEYEKFIKKIIVSLFPCTFIENFKYIYDKVETFGWPKKPKVIFTSHAINTKTISSFYIAKKKELGSTLIHGQHGGAYGQCLFHWYEDFEKSISDVYFTWGWENSRDKKIVNIGMLKSIEKLKKVSHYSKKNLITFVIRPKERYFSTALDSKSRGDQILNYHQDCLQAANLLNNKILSKSLCVRLHERKYGWNEKEMWKDKFENIYIDEGFEPIIKTINKSRLIVYTYNSTGYLELLAANLPVILFWSDEVNLLRDDALKYFEKLEEVGIYHKTPESASSHINSNWNNISSWWNSDRVQSARKEFCKNFCNENKNIVESIANQIKNYE